MNWLWSLFLYHVWVFFDTIPNPKVSISLGTSIKNQQSLHVAILWFPSPFLATILIRIWSILEYFRLHFRNLFLSSFCCRILSHFGSKNALSELRQITPGRPLAWQIGFLVSKTPPTSLKVTFASSYGGYLHVFSTSSGVFWHDFHSIFAYQMTVHISHEEIQFA